MIVQHNATTTELNVKINKWAARPAASERYREQSKNITNKAKKKQVKKKHAARKTVYLHTIYLYSPAYNLVYVV